MGRSVSTTEWVRTAAWAGAFVLCLLPQRGAAQAPSPAELPPPPTAGQPDLSSLPEIDDTRPTEIRPPAQNRAPVPNEYGTAPAMAMPYLGQMLSEPEIDFVPSTPSPSMNPHAVWEGMMIPPQPSPAELRARRLRNAGIGLLTLGTILSFVAVPSLASSTEAPLLQALGYSTLAGAALSFASGGALFGIGDGRLRAARRSAAGLALVPAGPGFALSW